MGKHVMAWNGSDAHCANGRAARSTGGVARRSGSSPRRVRVSRIILVALVPLAILCGIVVWFALRSDRGETDVRNAPAAKRNPTERNQRKTPRIFVGEDDSLAFKTDSLPSAAIAETPSASEQSAEDKPRNVIVNDGSHRPPDRYAVLTLNCDKQIAGLLYAVPGQLMIGTVEFGEDFEQQFRESLKTKLKPSQDATEEEREMIEAVNDAKEAVVKAMRAEGKTAGEILSEARQQLREFGQYKQMLGQELRRYESDEEKTDEDVSDLFDAANIILKENGIAPFEPNDLTREIVRQYKFDQQEKNEQ